MIDIASIRTDYKRGSLDEHQVAAEPMAQFNAWFEQAIAAEVPEVNAMALASVAENGQPSVRIVLLKGVDARGFIFFTNYQSRKGRELDNHPQAAATFFWHELERQVRIEGYAERIPEEDSTAYFNSRDRASRIGAWASPQSEVIAGRHILEERVERFGNRFLNDENPPRPDHWGGYKLVPHSVEFWQGRPSRLHDRIRYTRTETGIWNIERLAP